MAINDKQEPLGVGRLHFNNPGEAQIRFMAVDTEYQRKGMGVRLLKALEQKAAQLGARQIVLNSRETALGFYKKQGYQSVGPGWRHTIWQHISCEDEKNIHGLT